MANKQGERNVNAEIKHDPLLSMAIKKYGLWL
jgi:hypothetical protein